MRAPWLAIAVGLTACGGAGGAVAPTGGEADRNTAPTQETDATPHSTEEAAGGDSERAPERTPPRGEPILLRRSHGAAARYRRTVTVFMSDDGSGSPVRLTVNGTVEVVPRAGAFHAEMTFAEATLSHDGQPATLPRGMVGLSQVTVSWADDARNRHLAPATIQGETPDNEAFVREMVEGMAVMHIPYPEEPVPVGGVVEAPTVDWDTRPVGWVVAHVSRTARLERVEPRDGARVAVLGIEAHVTVDPFTAMGLALEGDADMRGSATLDLSDGYARRMVVDGEAVLRPAGSTGSGPRIVLKLVDEIVRMP